MMMMTTDDDDDVDDFDDHNIKVKKYDILKWDLKLMKNLMDE